MRGSFSTGAPLVGKKTENYYPFVDIFCSFFEQPPGGCSVSGPVLGTEALEMITLCFLFP